MDEYLNHLMSSSSWADADVKQRLSWGCIEPGQPNVSTPNLLGLYESDKRNSSISMISSSQSVEFLATQDTSSVVGSKSNYAFDNGLISGEAQLHEDSQNCNGNPSPTGMLNSSLKVGNTGMEYDAAVPAPMSLNLGYPKQLPVVGDLTSSLSFTGAGDVGCNGSEQSEYHRSFKNLQNLSSIPQLQPSQSYDGVSSLSPLMVEDRMQEFGLQEGDLDDDIDIMGKRYVSMDKIMQLDKFSASVATKAKDDLLNFPLSSLATEPSTTMATSQLSSLPQTTSAAPAAGNSGMGKPRVRARRGQATDPHSIAERLRREKIAERMKNLQELVPNSNKVDKASMLDEIIEYVKFLQLQVKVLSMSRLGAAGAVIPLITDGQAEGSNSLSLSPSAGLGIDISLSPDQIAFEQEVLKLMESNVTMAMQYLQSKGLCLMPIALAAAISTGKTSLPGTASEDRKKFCFTNGLVHSNSSSSTSSSSSSCSLPGIDTHQMPYDGNIMTGKFSSKGIMVNSCNGTSKHEEVKNA